MLTYDAICNQIADAHGDDFAIDVHDAISKAVDGLDFVDNHRIALKGNRDHMIAYDDSRYAGCCGSVDTSVVIDGITVLFGFNYGH